VHSFDAVYYYIKWTVINISRFYFGIHLTAIVRSLLVFCFTKCTRQFSPCIRDTAVRKTLPKWVRMHTWRKKITNSSGFCVITQGKVFWNRRFGTACRSVIQSSSSSRNFTLESGLLCGVKCRETDVSGLPIGYISKGQAVQETWPFKMVG
jgi:hypothetical protein